MLRYAITDPKLYGSDPESLKRRLERVLTATPVDIVCLRDKTSSDYEALAEAFLSMKPRFPRTLFFLHTDIALARRLAADGIHLPSHLAGEASRAGGLKVIVSTHSFEEAAACEAHGAWGVTYGPVFETPGKGPPKGLEKLKEITGKMSINLFALGGIVTPEHVDAVGKAGADGFASIRYFVQSRK
ncbi:thiamine phosphate synthase [Hydrogenimonas sp.]